MTLPNNPILQSLQNQIQALPQAQQFSVKVEAEKNNLLQIKLTRQASTQPNYDSLWESIRLQLRLISSSLKGQFTRFTVVVDFEEKIEWSNSSPIDKNGNIALSPKETKIGVVILGVLVGIIGLMSIFNQPKSTPTNPSVQTKDPNCLYIPESFVPSGMSYEDYKAKVKRETGAKCVFFTGG